MQLSAHVDAATTIPELFFAQVRDMGEQDALRWKEGDAWLSLTYGEWGVAVRGLAAALAPSVRAGDKVALLCENRKEWTFVDLAVLGLGGILAPIYPTSPPPDVAYIINDAGAQVLFVSSAEQLERVLALRAEGAIDIVEQIVVLDEVDDRPDDVLTLAALVAQGGDEGEIDRRMEGLDPEEMATLIYTSGTTGEPKGVMLSHRNLIRNVHAAFHRMGEDAFRQTVFLSFLPLSHSLERTCGYYMAIRVAGTIAYAEGIDKLLTNFGEVRPTVLISVPRIYEKIYAAVFSQASSGLKKEVFDWALKVGKVKAHAEAERKPVPLVTRLLYPLAFRLVFRKIHDKMGGRMEFAISGGAPLAREIAVFLKAAGLTVLEGYGLTETAPILTINGPAWTRFGAVGQAVEDVEIKIDPEPDAERPDEGEILARGPNIMIGYYGKEEATREVLDDDRWFRTGDIGYMDDDGFVFITDRKKELLKTSGGKYVAPAPIENSLKLSPFIEQACVIGNRRKFCTALLAPDVAALARELGRELSADGAGVGELPEVKALMQAEVDAANDGLGKWEQIKYFTVLPRLLSVEDGELTPTLKMKRRIIDEHFLGLIDSMYS